MESAVIHAVHAQTILLYRKGNVNRFSDDEK